MPKTLSWARIGSPGAEHALLDDRSGLSARGTVLAVDPVPYTCRYDLRTDPDWATVRLEVACEGAGWLRSIKLERAAGRWRAGTAEQGDLAAALAAAGRTDAGLPGTEDPDRLESALDVDLSGSVLFNSLPVRRLGLHRSPPGTAYPIEVAWVLLPSLVVLPAAQHYTALAGGGVRFEIEGFTADVALDDDGYVTHYPGLAERVGPVRR
nr:putative glycolipid-binding domain-containing protein [Micromonospora sp. DSM 115978]